MRRVDSAIVSPFERSPQKSQTSPVTIQDEFAGSVIRFRTDPSSDSRDRFRMCILSLKATREPEQ